MQEESKQGQWTARLRDQANAGVPISKWCKLNGVTEAAFHYWRRRLNRAAPTAPQLVALPFSSARVESMLELETPHGYVIRFYSQEQLGWLGAVLAELR